VLKAGRELRLQKEMESASDFTISVLSTSSSVGNPFHLDTGVMALPVVKRKPVPIRTQPKDFKLANTRVVKLQKSTPLLIDIHPRRISKLNKPLPPVPLITVRPVVAERPLPEPKLSKSKFEEHLDEPLMRLPIYLEYHFPNHLPLRGSIVAPGTLNKLSKLSSEPNAVVSIIASEPCSEASKQPTALTITVPSLRKRSANRPPLVVSPLRPCLTQKPSVVTPPKHQLRNVHTILKAESSLRAGDFAYQRRRPPTKPITHKKHKSSKSAPAIMIKLSRPFKFGKGSLWFRQLPKAPSPSHICGGRGRRCDAQYHVPMIGSEVQEFHSHFSDDSDDDE
jgi:hypothetical protein